MLPWVELTGMDFLSISIFQRLSSALAFFSVSGTLRSFATAISCLTVGSFIWAGLVIVYNHL